MDVNWRVYLYIAVTFEATLLYKSGCNIVWLYDILLCIVYVCKIFF